MSFVLAKTLLVKVVDEDGVIGFQTYKLNHVKGGGYDVERVFGNNNLKGWLTRPIEFFKLLVNLVKGLVK